MACHDSAVLLQRRARQQTLSAGDHAASVPAANLYDLSDEATAAEAIDSRAFSDFCGVDSSNQVPDGDTIGRFRNLLVKNGLQEKLFAQVVAALMKRG